MPRLFLHIGTVKTGTTYLQKVLHDNPDVMRRQGVSYPYVFPPELHLPRYANAKFLFDRSRDVEASEVIASAEAPNVLISEENIFQYIEHLNHPAFEGMEKRIVLYVRPAAELLAAWAAEASQPYNVLPAILDIPHPMRSRILPLDDLLDIASLEYAVHIGRFMNLVDEIGRENFIIRPFERASLIGNDLLTDFLRCMGVDAAAVRADPQFRDPGLTNVSRSRKFCDVSHALWLYLGRPAALDDFNIGLVEAVTEACASGDSRPVVETLTDAQIAWLTYRFEHFESFLSKTFLDGRPLFKNRYPACYGVQRPPCRPIDSGELELRAGQILCARQEK